MFHLMVCGLRMVRRSPTTPILPTPKVRIS